MNKNFEILEEKYPNAIELYNNAKNADYSEEVVRAYIDTAIDGNDIIAFKKDDRFYYVNSRYNPDDAAKVWADRMKDSNPMSIYIIFGLGNGMHIRELLKNVGETAFVIAVEPSAEAFNIVMNEIDISDILSDDRFILAVNGITDGIYNEFLGGMLNYSNYQLVQIHSIPNYNKVFTDKYKELYATYKAAGELVVLDRNTHIRFAGEFITNMLKNFPDMLNQYTINSLRDNFKKEDLTDVPAIVVAAGPSLDKNIEELKNAVGKAFIIVVDTALKPVLNAGITPDITITVDPHKPLTVIDHEEVKNLPIVSCVDGNYKILTQMKNKIFYFFDNYSYIHDVYERHTGVDVSGLETGGSVSNNAFSLARYLGFKTIILVGQDLAFAGDKSHASSTYSEKVNKQSKLKKGGEVFVEGIDGKQISTMKNMEMYLRWFEKQIKIYPDTKVIDATEGGALKKGTEIMTLKEAVERECHREVRFKAIIDEAKPAFTDEEKIEVIKEFKEIPSRIKKFRKKCEQGVRDYNKFYELYKNGKSQEMIRYSEKLERVNNIMEEDLIFELITMYNEKDNFDVMEDIFNFKKDEDEEIRDIVDKGVKMLESYEKAIDSLLEDIHILTDVYS